MGGGASGPGRGLPAGVGGRGGWGRVFGSQGRRGTSSNTHVDRPSALMTRDAVPYRWQCSGESSKLPMKRPGMLRGLREATMVKTSGRWRESKVGG